MQRAVAILVLAAALVGVWLLARDSDSPGPALESGESARSARTEGGPALVARGARPQAPGSTNATTPESATPTGAEPRSPPPRTVIRYRGRVLDSEGRPIAGATVILRGSGLPPIRVKADGTFEVEVPAGRYDLLVRTDDGGVLYQENLSIGSDVADLVALTVEEGPSLAVVVIRDGEPARNVEVALTHTSDRSVGKAERALLRAQTLRGGRVVLGKPPKGVYELLFTFSDGLVARRPHEHESDGVVRFDVGKTVVVKGRVTEGTEGPGIAAAEVRLGGNRTTDTTWFSFGAATNAEGAFELAAPKAFYRDVRVSAEGYSPWPPMGGSTEERKERAPILTALRGVGRGTAADVRIPLVAAGRVSVRGLVQDGEKKPVTGVDVRIVLGSNRIDQPTEVVTTAETGGFEVGGLRPGVYRAFVVTGAWVTHRAPTFTVEEGADDAIDVLVEVRPAGGLSGSVVKQDGSPVAGARVWLDNTGPVEERQPNVPNEDEVYTGTGGRWRIGGLRTHMPKVVHAAWGGMRSAPLQVAPYKDGETELVLTLAPAVTLRVLIVEQGTSRGVPGARVKFEPEPAFGRPKFTMFCDDDGRFEIEQVLPAKWKTRPWSWWHLEHDEQEVDLTGKAGVVEVRYELDPGLAIAGRVHDDRGEPLVATIKISGADSDNRKIWRDLKSDADGLFRATGFLQGSYVLTASADGHKQAAQRDLKGGEEHLDLKLEPQK